MSTVLIVSKTKMAQQKICVGGVDVEKHRSIRLMNENGYHETLAECPYNIFDVWDLDYLVTSSRPLPHSSEDVNVRHRKKLGILQKDVNVRHRKKLGILQKDVNVIDLLKRSGVNVYTGNIDNVFNGCLKSTDKGSLFISEPEVPNYSTCFWICDRDLKRIDYQNKTK